MPAQQEGEEIMAPKTPEHPLWFRLGLWWRVFYGIVKVVFGGVLWWIAGGGIARLFYRVMSHEIAQDPSDFFVHFVGPKLAHLPVTVTHFVAFYFIFWGIAELFLSIQILKKNIWAYPVAIILLSVFTLYELFRVAHTHSFTLTVVILIDAAVVWLLYREYRRLRS